MAEPLHLLAAGSLSRAFGGLGPVSGRPVVARFGPSGLLRQKIEDGSRWDLFASADTAHPARLHAAGVGTEPRIFCHNALAVILRGAQAAEVTDLLMNPDLRLGIATPGNDPSGDYALAALERLDPALCSRALRLTAAPDLPQPPPGRNAYAWILTSGAADLFLTYRTNALAALRDTPALQALDLPETMQVRASYAMTTRTRATAADRLAGHILSPQVQSRLAVLGFTPAIAPAAERKSE